MDLDGDLVTLRDFDFEGVLETDAPIDLEILAERLILGERVLDAL